VKITDSKLIGIAVTFTGAVLFSTKAIFVKLAFKEMSVDVIHLLALRMLCALPFFLLAAWWSSGKDQSKLSYRNWMTIFFLGLMGYYVSSWFDFKGLMYISAGLERLILFLYPSFTALINYFFFKQALQKRQQWAMLLSYVGIAIAYSGETMLQQNTHQLLGSALVFVCAVTYSIYMAGAGRVIPRAGVTRFTAYAMLSATMGIFLHFVLVNQPVAMAFSWSIWKYGLLLAIIATVLPAFLISAGMRRIGANNAAIVSSIGPVSTILQAYLFLNEPIHTTQIFGTLLVITGVILVGWKS
jgi:drug/metabolite transporter (DMT)-like permease